MDNNKEVLKVLNEILKWIKIGNIKEVGGILQKTLSDDDKKLIYHYSDGSKGILNFNEISTRGKSSIANYWKDWFRLGLVEMVNVKGGSRAKKLFELEDFGISIPSINIQSVSNLDKENEQEIISKEILVKEDVKEDNQKEEIKNE